MKNNETKLINSLIEIVKSNIIDIKEKEIINLYDKWNNNNIKKEKWIFDKNLIKDKQHLPISPYLLGIDFPFWFGDINSSNKKIIIIGIDPLRNEKGFENAEADKENDVLIGTPYALHSEIIREGKTRPYYEFVKSLSFENFVYLTDIYKTFFYTDKSKKERSYTYYNKNKVALSETRKILKKEIDLIKPDLIITLGAISFVQLTGIKCPKLSRKIELNKVCLKEFENIPIIPMMHLSGSSRTNNLIAFLEANSIETKQKTERWKFGLAYTQIIENYFSNSK